MGTPAPTPRFLSPDMTAKHGTVLPTMVTRWLRSVSQPLLSRAILLILPQAAFLQTFHDATAGYFTRLEEIPGR